jgi:hypothetical protein
MGWQDDYEWSFCRDVGINGRGLFQGTIPSLRKYKNLVNFRAYYIEILVQFFKLIFVRGHMWHASRNGFHVLFFPVQLYLYVNVNAPSKPSK